MAMPFNTADGTMEAAAAEHIQRAYQDPASTRPPNEAKDIPRQTASRPLHRLYDDTDR
ncbi:hypothetical protein RM572_21160 [Streptomyces sp. DSM 42041]|uniref:Uncharacterized protein n=1 Tax=Streptomyces hazeniae TaxID=3075538 RepID=A0ABU2NW99_9ACTN|nr:hypothetical protein [Streptomyces sp. DSM 42041]MDT0381270.1 hypothetical protein [Streptomyces sp. DSM 42041]